MSEDQLHNLAHLNADVLIYALGSGLGHLTRGLSIVRALRARGELRGSAVILHQADGPRGASSTSVHPAPAGPASAKSTTTLIKVGARCSSARLQQSIANCDIPRLVVDTFPGGVGHELDDATLQRFEHTTLVRRYVRKTRYGDYDALAARYDVSWLPYNQDDAEWEAEDVQGCALMGRLVREVTIATAQQPAPLVVIGPLSALPQSWLGRLPLGTISVDRPFTTLPAARRYLALSAGYNLTYELLSLDVEARFIPRERRWDDQHRRAGLLGRAIFDRVGLQRWLSDVAIPSPHGVRLADDVRASPC